MKYFTRVTKLDIVKMSMSIRWGAYACVDVREDDGRTFHHYITKAEYDRQMLRDGMWRVRSGRTCWYNDELSEGLQYAFWHTLVVFRKMCDQYNETHKVSLTKSLMFPYRY